MSQISTWYNNQYSGAFRSTRLRAPSLVPSNRVAVNQQTLVVDGRNQGTGAGTGTADAPGKDGQAAKRRETIFGPDVGEDDEPGWTSPDDGVKVGVDTVRGWVERAKAEEGLHATTTLQALVNLKRPTLQLLQLDAAPDPRVAIRRDLASIPAGTVLATPENGTQDATRSMSTSTHLGVDDINPALRSMSMSSAFSTGSGMSIPSAPLHLIKFAYDATAPSVRITLTIHPRLSTAPAVEGKESIHEEEQAEAVKTVYTGLHPGGFNQAFQLPHSAAMDLSSAVAPMPPAGSEEDDDKKNLSGGAGVRGANSEDTTRTSYERGMSNMSTTLATVPEVDGGNGTDANGNDTNAGVGGRVRNLFGRRRRENDVEQGNIEMEERNAEAAKGGEEEQKEEKGMRVLIRIEGVGAEGEPLSRRNAQLTHILVTGMWVADNTASTAAVDEQAPVPANTGKRVWVVKVVRREAIIGAHTFLLKEIYGLSTAASATSATPSYPPTADATDPYASTPNECIVCLTSPRDVVLLPCRHLVVCRECAVGMVEFGAGGKVARRDGEGDDTADGTTGASAGTDGTAAAAPTGPAPAVAGGTTTGGRERRKKKAKGWYCPVCRQPYTSLLRLALPEVGGGEATEEAAHEHAHAHTDADADGLSLNRTRSRGAASIKSHRTGRQSLYLHKVGSRATLPDGAERMLEALRPDADSESDEDEYEVGNNGSGNANGNGTGEGRSRAHGGFDGVVPESERPQFVLGDEVDLDDKAGNASANGGKAKGKENEEDQKAEVEHREVADWQAQHAAAESAPGRTSEDGKKGWKEV